MTLDRAARRNQSAELVQVATTRVPLVGTHRANIDTRNLDLESEGAFPTVGQSRGGGGGVGVPGETRRVGNASPDAEDMRRDVGDLRRVVV